MTIKILDPGPGVVEWGMIAAERRVPILPSHGDSPPPFDGDLASVKQEVLENYQAAGRGHPEIAEVGYQFIGGVTERDGDDWVYRFGWYTTTRALK